MVRRSTTSASKRPTARRSARGCSPTTSSRSVPVKHARCVVPKRREIGHGALARRALLTVMPGASRTFPYVLRSTVRGPRVQWLVLDGHGVRLHARADGCRACRSRRRWPASRWASSRRGDDYAVLSDILGDEDHLGDMDFKVTGTREGITAFQMDCKITGGEPRDHGQGDGPGARWVGSTSSTRWPSPSRRRARRCRSTLPRITTLHINTDKIRDLIGPGGKVIRSIQDVCEVRVTVDDSGRVDVASSNQDKTDKAIQMIREITQEAEIGALYLGVVKRIVDFGAFVEIFPGTDGLIHISHLAHERVGKVTDVLSGGRRGPGSRDRRRSVGQDQALPQGSPRQPGRLMQRDPRSDPATGRTGADLPLPAWQTAGCGGGRSARCGRGTRWSSRRVLEHLDADRAWRLALPDGWEAQVRPRSGLAHGATASRCSTRQAPSMPTTAARSR